MAVRFDPGIFSLIGISSEILVGAELNWYESGTSTPLATYSDPGLTIPNTNPVIAGADGRFGNIWLQDADYKLVLQYTDEFGNTVNITRDPIDGKSPLSPLLPASGAGLIGFSQSSTYPASTIGKHDQAQVLFEDDPFSAKGDGTTNDSGAIATGAAFAQALHGVIGATRGARYRLNTGVSLTGAPLTIQGVADSPLQNSATLPPAAFLGYMGSGAIMTLGTGTSYSTLKDFAIENRSGATTGVLLSSGTAYQIDGVSSLNFGGTYSRLDALFDTDTSAFAYLKVRNITAYSSSCKVVFRCGKQNGNPTQFPTPMSFDSMPEIAAVDGVSMTFLSFPGNRFEQIDIKRSTFNSYSGAELLIVDATDNLDVVDYNTGYAGGNIDFNSEIDVSSAPASTVRSFKLYNTSLLKLESTISGSAIASIASLRNSKALVQNTTATSVNGPICDVQDLESMVEVGQGVTLNQFNTLGIFNSSVALASATITATTVNGSMTITVTNTTAPIYPGMPFTGGGGTLANGYILRQLSGTKWGNGTYAVTVPATATGSVTLATTAATYPTNAGIYTVPRFVDSPTNYYFIETWRAENGVHTFKIVVTDSAAFTIFVSNPFLNSPKPLSHRSRGKPLNIVVENRSGGALGAVTLGSNIQLSAAIAPANNKAASFTIGMDVSISGTTVTEYFRQIGGIDQAIPLF